MIKLSNQTLWSAKMDGSEPEQFYEFSHHPHIRSLTYSKEQHQLYWICCQNRQIQRYIFSVNFNYVSTYAFDPNFVFCQKKIYPRLGSQPLFMQSCSKTLSFIDFWSSGLAFISLHDFSNFS